jgi:uncharacterized protein YecT (DUF1311 family)
MSMLKNRNFHNMKKIIFVVSLFISFNVFPKCNPDSALSNDMQECAVDDYKNSDDKLNKIYQEIMQNLKTGLTNTKSVDDKKLYETLITDLKNSQRDWIKFRDSECARLTGVNTPNSGREVYLLYSSCPSAMTKERTKVLTAKCEEGDIGCISYGVNE